MNWLQIYLFGSDFSSFSTNSYGYYSQKSQNLISNDQIFTSAQLVRRAASKLYISLRSFEVVIGIVSFLIDRVYLIIFLMLSHTYVVLRTLHCRENREKVQCCDAMTIPLYNKFSGVIICMCSSRVSCEGAYPRIIFSINVRYWTQLR